MILKRKMYDKLLTLKNKLSGKKAFLIEGARRIGKSTICEEFGKNEYKSYILIDFAKCPDEVRDYFVKYMNDLDAFFMLLSTYYGVRLHERESLIIFDEVQIFLISNNSKLKYKMFPIEVKSGKKYSIESLKRFKEKYKARIGVCYVIHPRNLSFKEDIICIPPYMTICL